SAVSPSSARRRTCAQDVLMAGHAPTDLDVMTTRPPRAASVSERTAAPPPPPPPVATRERGFLPFAAPLIGDEEIQEVVDTLRSSWITTGPKAKRFEQEFAAYLGAAHALPAKYKGRAIGSGANPVAFSFYATKNLTTAEGGMLTGDAAFLERARTLSLHGMSRDAWSRYDRGGSWFYEVIAPGFKYNMTDIQAALGLWQLRKLARFQERRRAVVRLYTEAFADQDALEVPVERSDVEHAWHLYVLRLREEALRIDRNVFIDELKQRNIGTSVHFIPIHLHPYYRDKYGYGPESFPVAYGNYRRMLSLPLSARVSDADAADVIAAVLDIVR